MNTTHTFQNHRRKKNKRISNLIFIFIKLWIFKDFLFKTDKKPFFVYNYKEM